MKKIAEVHTNHSELVSDINFLTREIMFLLRLLRNAYSTSVQNEEIKMLDAYWKQFEKYKGNLGDLLEKIHSEEIRLKTSFINDGTILFNENERFQLNYQTLYKEIRLVKESFYDFIINSGKCNKCLL